MSKEITLVLGAVEDSSRFANKAAKALLSKGHRIAQVGKREGEVGGEPILTGKPQLEDIHTVTLYIGTNNLPPMFDYILGLEPKRIIFNPGTYHPELERLAEEKGIEVVNGCTLVMLASGQY